MTFLLLKFGAHRRSCGFTLTELLVVMSILIVISGIVISAVVWGKGKAQSTSCLSSIKQLGIAGELYLQDYDHVFPQIVNQRYQDGVEPLSSWHTWRDDISPYIDGSLNCSLVRRAPNLPSQYTWGFAINQSVNRTSTVDQNGKVLTELAPRTSMELAVPATTIFFSECDFYYIALSDWRTFGIKISFGVVAYDLALATEPVLYNKRHFDGSNYAMMDGSAKWIHHTQAGWDDDSQYKYRF